MIGKSHGETVCCAGIDLYGNWLRLYPVSFRVLDDGKKFKRWDRIKFNWRTPTTDDRIESRHVDSQTLEIVGRLPDREKESFLAQKIVTSLDKEREEGRSLALLKPEIKAFNINKKSNDKLAEQQKRIDAFHAQSDFFVPKPAVPSRACPYEFVYRYITDDGEREGTCQDWETEATFFNWSRTYGEAKALSKMQQQFGRNLPQKGLMFAMGTHSRWPDTWLINGLIQIKEPDQSTLI
ncbi:hypothetical protein [Hoeflea poritis]|uniref:Uncharacterized protein n=1 Tax=Hoeflea poritis TaxID=2993659 RepID=A0ABT4VTW1_9HYPH|nr:hypothetical protein [Hoeflea poritis]MDA4848049.1 hypothetical protein [Hoeflea poritis]